eukprot:TRINITY_DN59055_c0_g1_i2.p1 TRINITY_DN59055_c0_g1~~TRINITY_DN59055_c0_g1_i2.p1  ORF type:complete len:555 (+),score=146.07 TRINITY_DN59055_c0_g1_i2:122-1786(+)
MGASSSSKKGLEQAVSRAESRAGKITITGRYHKVPKQIEDDYDLEKKVLGEGYNGQVTLAKSKRGGHKYAVKPFKLTSIDKEKRDELASECEIFLGMDHPHVARLVDVYESAESLQLVMECMTGGELFTRIQKRKRFSEQDASEATRQMLLAINYLHSHGVVHRDLKLENFLYESEESEHLKLIDFGFSKVWKPNTKMALSCGTLSYVAPEVLGKNYTSQCDMWSLGVIVFILLVGYMPFSGSENNQIRDIKKANYLVKKDKWETVSAVATDFVKGLLVVDPAQRMTPSKALEHDFVKEQHRMSHRESAVDTTVVEALANFGQASAFRRACMNVMAWSLTVEERQKVRDAFLELDVDRTGVIKLWEFKQALDKHFHLSDDQAKAAFAALDTGHTDEIHYSEFLAAMCSTRIALHEDLLRNTFKRFDTDNSGYITAQNLRDVLGQSFEGKQVESLLKEVDFNTDGKISYDEFLDYLRHPEADEVHLDAANKMVDTGLGTAANDRDRRMRAVSDKTGTGVEVGVVQVEVDDDKAAKKTTNDVDTSRMAARCGCAIS